MFKNLIINGDMRIDQRNDGASLTPTFNGEYCLDRYQNSLEQLNKYSVQRNAGSITPPAGFKNYLGVTSLTNLADQNSAYYVISQHIEGENIRQLNFGTADAVSVSLSFYIRSSLTGQFGGSLRNSGTGGFRSYPFIYTINNANTWERKTITITGDTVGTWLNDTGLGISVFFDIGCGSDNTGTANAWGTQNKLGATGSVRVVGTSGATWYITGLQLEAGTSATNFEHLPIEITRKRCYRYFQYYNLLHHTAIGGVFGDTGGIWTPFFYYPKGEMRATPSVTYQDEVGNAGKWRRKTSLLLVARQNGKTHLARIRILAGLFVFGEKNIVAMSSNRGMALDTFRKVVEVIEDNPMLMAQVKQIRVANGQESVELLRRAQFFRPSLVPDRLFHFFIRFLAVRMPRCGKDLPASESAMATACLRDLTTGPPLPECSVPALYSPITFLTFLSALVIFI